MEATPVSRIRWAALGAAVAVALGAGIVPVARAVVGSGERSVFVPITPCRLMDTRGGGNTVGPRSTPIGAGESHQVTVHGNNGRCTIPTDATAIATNTTVANGSQASFLSVYPANAARPQASNLNWVSGQAPTPNQVTVGLSPDGRIRVYNDRGTVNVVMDIIGYFVHHHHDDRYYTKAQIDSGFYTKHQHDSLPSSALVAFGTVLSDGSLFANFPNSGNFTVSKEPGAGAYTISVANAVPCLPSTFPHFSGTALSGVVFWTVMTLGNCVGGTRTANIGVIVKDLATHADANKAFEFRVYVHQPDVAPSAAKVPVDRCSTAYPDGTVEVNACG